MATSRATTDMIFFHIFGIQAHNLKPCTNIVLTAKIGTNRSDQAVWPVEPLWPVRQGPTGLTGPGRVLVQLGFFIDLDL